MSRSSSEKSSEATARNAGKPGKNRWQIRAPRPVSCQPIPINPLAIPAKRANECPVLRLVVQDDVACRREPRILFVLCSCDPREQRRSYVVQFIESWGGEAAFVFVYWGFVVTFVLGDPGGSCRADSCVLSRRNMSFSRIVGSYLFLVMMLGLMFFFFWVFRPIDVCSVGPDGDGAVC